MMTTTSSIPAPEVDPVSVVLDTLSLNGLFYCRTELTAPWGLYLPPMSDQLWFHVMLSGEGTVTSGDITHDLTLGDVCLLPHGTGHTIRSAPGVAAPNVLDLPHDMADDRYALLRHGGDGEPALLICGTVRIERHSARELVSLLPPVITMRADPTDAWLTTSIQMMALEAQSPRAGTDTMLTRLADLLIVQVLRVWIDDQRGGDHWIGALLDPDLGPAMRAMHARPGEPWTVESLAVEAAMSRTTFSERFHDVVGEPPFAYLTRLRMNEACDRLMAGEPISGVAFDVGYGSQAAFSRAFKSTFGLPPGQWRRAMEAQPFP